MKQTIEEIPLENTEAMPKTRPATEEDFEFALKTHHDAYRDVVVRQFSEWDEASQDKYFKDEWVPDKYQIILSNGTDSAGYCSVVREPGHIMLKELVVSPDFKKQKLGTNVLADLVFESKTTNIPIKLIVLRENIGAQRLYTRFGFKKTRETDNHFEMVFDPNKIEA